MSISSRASKTAALILSGAAIGAAMGYAVSASGAGTPHAQAQSRRPHARAGRAKSRAKRLERAVSITAVVPAGGGKFTTLSIARGTLVSTGNDTVTLREGTRRATYSTVTLALGANPTVRLSKQTASLASLSAGDRVAVVKGPSKTVIVARPPRVTRSASTIESAGSSS